jgi:renalase
VKVAIVGAGMAGAACARALADAGQMVRLFDKGRSVGGRLAQRRVEQGVFDHGAQYFTARDPAFVAAVEDWRAQGIVADWPGGIGSDGRGVMVGVPAMSAPVKALLADLPVSTGWRVTKLGQATGGWTFVGEDGRRDGPFGAVLLAVPAAQAADLLATAGEAGAAALLLRLGGVRMAPCWSVMVAFAAPLGGTAPTLRPADGPLAWAACNASKPGRGNGETWTLHGTPDWSRAWLERDPAEVAPDLVAAFAAALGRPLPEPNYLAAHRWRYALAERPLSEPCLWDAALQIGLCGDWCLGPRVEAAFLSGRALAATALAGLAKPGAAR